MDIPEFDGKLRAHIVAYNNDAIGSVEDTLNFKISCCCKLTQLLDS